MNNHSLPPSDRDDAPERPLPLAIVPPPQMPAVVEETDDDSEEIPANDSVGLRGVQISAAVVTKATANLDDRSRTAIRWLHDRCFSRMSWSELEKEVGISKSALHRVFRGVYTYPKTQKVDGVPRAHPKAGQAIALKGVVDKIEALRRGEEKKRALFSVGFLQTSTWQKIDWGCKQALKHNKIVFFYGDGQIGKTTCLEEFARLNNGGRTKFVRVPPVGGAQSLLKAIARGCKVGDQKPHDVLMQDVIAALDKSNLLILDELHEIFTCYPRQAKIRCMEMIRYIWDQSHCGLVLTGTNLFRDKLKQGEFFEEMRSLNRRGLRPIQLPPVAPDSDLQLAVKSFGLEWPTNEKLLEELHHLAEDGFGQFLMRLEDGKSVAVDKNSDYDWSHFKTAVDLNRQLALGVTREAA